MAKRNLITPNLNEAGVNSPFAKRLTGLFDEHPKTKKKTPYSTFAKEYGATQQAVSQWVNGATVPDTKYIICLSEYFNVTCDYILGKSAIPAPDINSAEITERTGLSPDAVKSLNQDKQELAIKMGAKKYTHQPKYADTVNLLLTSDKGKALLNALHAYLLGDKSASEAITYKTGEPMDIEQADKTNKRLKALSDKIAINQMRVQNAVKALFDSQYPDYNENYRVSYESSIDRLLPTLEGIATLKNTLKDLLTQEETNNDA